MPCDTMLRGTCEKLRTIYQKVLQIEPNQPVALHLLGVLAHQVGKNQIAVDLIGKSLAIQPENAEAQNNFGVSLNELGKLDEAVASYHKALAINPDYTEAHFNLGNTFKELGELEMAVTSFHKARDLDPDNSKIHNNLGVVLNKLNKPDEAAECIQKVLTLQPDNAEAHNNLGVLQCQQDKIEEAIDSYHAALAINPDYAEAHFNLGNTMRDLNILDAAAVSYSNAIAAKPDYAEAYNNLGQTLKDMNELDEAAACYDKAISINPDFANAHNNLGIIFQDMGKLDDAATEYRQAIALKRDYSEAYRNLGQIIKRQDYDEEIQAMEKLYAMPDIDDERRMHLAFALGKAFEDLQQYEKAFGFIADGNAIKRQSCNYCINDTVDFSNRVKQIFDSTLFTKNRSAGYKDETPIFILGMPRSGTTLVEQIIANHPQVYGAGELDTFNQVFSSSIFKATGLEYPEGIRKLESADFEQLGQEYAQTIREHDQEARFITDKMPGNYKHIGLIKLIMPNAKVIHCRRDPADTCLSIFKTYFIDKHEYSYDLVELARYYNVYRDLMAHWHTVLPGFIHDVQYEDMVADNARQTRDLLKYCGLEWDENCIEFYKSDRVVKTASAAQVRKPIYNNSVQLWKNYERQLTPMLECLD